LKLRITRIKTTTASSTASTLIDYDEILEASGSGDYESSSDPLYDPVDDTEEDPEDFDDQQFEDTFVITTRSPFEEFVTDEFVIPGRSYVHMDLPP
jgi:hypothetical protein